MANILKHTGENISGMIPLWWVYAGDVSQQTINKQTLACIVTLATGKLWNFLYGTPYTIDLDSEEAEKPAGVQYNYKIKCLVPQDRADVQALIRQVTRRGIIIWAKDKNGIIRIFGTPENPMRLTAKLKKPATVEDFNGWELVFTGAFSLPAFYGVELADSEKSTV